MKKLLALILTFTFLSLFTVLPEEKDEDTGETVTIAFSPGKWTLDPLHLYTTIGLEISTGIYEGLVTYHPFTMEPLPGAAERWEVSDDGKTYKFFLREDALYSNGDPVKASDFRDAWLRMIDPKNRAEYSFLFDIIEGASDYRKGLTSNPEDVGIRVISDRELDVTLTKPASHFLKILCHASFLPLHPRYIKDKNWKAGGIIVGNGPFLMYRRSNSEIILKKNKLYWDAKNVKVDSIRIIFTDDVKKISEDFLEGKVDWSDDWDPEIIKDSSMIVAHPSFGTGYLFFVSDKAPWNDYRVRKGLSLLIPWEKIRNDNFPLPTSTLVPSIPGYPKVKGIEKENDKEAFKLLKEAGFDRGKGLPKLRFMVIGHSRAEKIAREIAKIWKEKLSLESEIVSYSFEDYMKNVKKGNFTIGSSTWIGDFADPLTFLELWKSNSNLNDARFSDPEFDRLIEESYSETGKKHYETLAKAEEILLSRAVVIPLNNAPSYNLIDLKRIGGWYPNPLNIHPLKYLFFKKQTLPPGVVLNLHSDHH